MFGVDFVDLFSCLLFLDYISPFNICCKADLVVLNSLKFCLSVKLFILQSILNEILARYSNLRCRFFLFSTLNISCHSLLACRVSAERSAVKCIGFPCMLLAASHLSAFNILCVLVFVTLISMCLSISLGVSCMGCFVTLGIDYFLFYVGEIFNYNLFKNFLITFPFLFFLWDLYNSNAGMLDIIPDVSETILRSLHSFNFILLIKSYFHHFNFQLPDLFCFR